MPASQPVTPCAAGSRGHASVGRLGAGSPAAALTGDLCTVFVQSLPWYRHAAWGGGGAGCEGGPAHAAPLCLCQRPQRAAWASLGPRAAGTGGARPVGSFAEPGAASPRCWRMSRGRPPCQVRTGPFWRPLITWRAAGEVLPLRTGAAHACGECNGYAVR